MWTAIGCAPVVKDGSLLVSNSVECDNAQIDVAEPLSYVRQIPSSTMLGMAVDIKTRRPVLRNNTGGYSGPAIKPVAVRMVAECSQVLDIPIIGCGGVMDYKDVKQPNQKPQLVFYCYELMRHKDSWG